MTKEKPLYEKIRKELEAGIKRNKVLPLDWAMDRIEPIFEETLSELQIELKDKMFSAQDSFSTTKEEIKVLDWVLKEIDTIFEKIIGNHSPKEQMNRANLSGEQLTAVNMHDSAPAGNQNQGCGKEVFEYEGSFGEPFIVPFNCGDVERENLLLCPECKAKQNHSPQDSESLAHHDEHHGNLVDEGSNPSPGGNQNQEEKA